MRQLSKSLVLVLLVACANPDIEEQKAQPATQGTQSWTQQIDDNAVMGLQLGADAPWTDGWSDPQLDSQQGLQTSISAYAQQGKTEALKLLISAQEEAELNRAYRQLIQHLDSLHGSSNPSHGYATWRAGSATGALVEIELLDERLLYQRPAILVQWRVHKDRRYED